MNTRDLARKLESLEIISCNKKLSKNIRKQIFDYLLVLDFEATCWIDTERKGRHSEIIEFPVVLYDVRNNEIIEEFQEYVKPVENPILSEFCIELTGIRQSQVDNGVPLETCLELFFKWLNDKMNKYNMEFVSRDHKGKKKCTFVTWSDWDLRTCLRNEFRRKHLEVSSIFRKWIDLRALYKRHYRRPLNGLVGALAELGLEFEGKQHCGLHDARNTARLASKMISDGTVLELTRG